MRLYFPYCLGFLKLFSTLLKKVFGAGLRWLPANQEKKEFMLVVSFIWLKVFDGLIPALTGILLAEHAGVTSYLTSYIDIPVLFSWSLHTVKLDIAGVS